MRKALWLAALALAACDGPAPPAANVATPEADSSENFAAEVAKLDPAQRNAVLFRAIRDSQQPCQGVVSAEMLNDKDGLPVWRATCDDKSTHYVKVGKDGTVSVVSAPTS